MAGHNPLDSGSRPARTQILIVRQTAAQERPVDALFEYFKGFTAIYSFNLKKTTNYSQ